MEDRNGGNETRIAYVLDSISHMATITYCINIHTLTHSIIDLS